ncbi:MAG: putative baseplate assembly protein [Caldilineaceae bacterium]
MARGRLEPPNLDDRTWQDIVDQAKALIPKYAPEWTDHNPSDLGITLIELFAWMVEGLIYRLNRVPEKSYIHMLNLLGITRDPATPAVVDLSFTTNGTNPVLIRERDQFTTKQTETEEAVVFEVDEDVWVCPNILQSALILHRGEQVTDQKGEPLKELDQSTGQEIPVTNYTYQSFLSLDKSIPIQIEKSASVTLAFGFKGKRSDQVNLYFKLSPPLTQSSNVTVQWSYSDAKDNYWPLNRVVVNKDGTEKMQKDGIIQLMIPETWASQHPADWRYTQPGSGSEPITEKLFWIGLEILNNDSNQPITVTVDQIQQIYEGKPITNRVRATNALTISQPELFGTSNGEPFQACELTHRPIYRESGVSDPYRRVKIEVQEENKQGEWEWQEWQRSDDFPQGDSRVYRLEPVTGTIYFGNFVDFVDKTKTPDGHGRIPPKGSKIRATYRYVANGAKGNVGAGTVTQIRKLSTGGSVQVTNLLPATGGVDEESIEETKRRAPQAIRTQDRAVTIADYEYLAREIGSKRVALVRCLSPRIHTQEDYDNKLIPDQLKPNDPWHYGNIDRSPGNINLIVVEAQTKAMPGLSEQLQREIENFLSSRRLVTTTVHVTDPRYVKINVTVKFAIWPTALATQGLTEEWVETTYAEKIRQFLHPLTGGINNQGWNIGDDFLTSYLLQHIQLPTELGYITDVVLVPEAAYVSPHPKLIDAKKVRPMHTEQKPEERRYRVALADFELICAGNIKVVAQ